MPPNEESKREIITTRIFAAPRETLFSAWTKPVYLSQWWGPNGFKNTIHSFELKPGGLWEFTMHSPDGIDYHNKSIFTEITEPSKIVFVHQKPIHRFEATATFDEVGGKTRVTFRMLFDTIKECEEVKSFIIEANEQNFDRLESVLAKDLIANI